MDMNYIYVAPVIAAASAGNENREREKIIYKSKSAKKKDKKDFGEKLAVIYEPDSGETFFEPVTYGRPSSRR